MEKHNLPLPPQRMIYFNYELDVNYLLSLFSKLQREVSLVNFKEKLSLLNACPVSPWLRVNICIQSILCQGSLPRRSDTFCMKNSLLLFVLNMASSSCIWWILVVVFKEIVDSSYPPYSLTTYFIDIIHFQIFFFSKWKSPRQLSISNCSSHSIPLNILITLP